MPNTVVIHRPGTTSVNEEFPDEARWTFSVNVNGQAGVAVIYSPQGASEGNVVAELHRTLMDNPDYMEGVMSAGSTGSSSPSTGPAATGPGVDGSPIINDDDDDPPKMKTADGT